jgi:hypothetical protein
LDWTFAIAGLNKVGLILISGDFNELTPNEYKNVMNAWLMHVNERCLVNASLRFGEYVCSLSVWTLDSIALYTMRDF